MAVYKRAYAGYSGAHTPTWSRFLVLARYSFSDLFQSRLFTALFVLTFVPVLVGIALIYLTNSETAQLLLRIQTGGRPLLLINNSFFLHWLEAQGWLGVLLTAWVGPSLIAPDLSNNALPLFLSRPFTRREYVLGKMVVLAMLLSLITWIPSVLMFAVQSAMAESGWMLSNLWLIGAIFAASWLWIIFVALLSLALSAWVRWRIIASALTFAIFIAPSGFGEALDAVLRTHWGRVFNLWYMTQVVWYKLFRAGWSLPSGVQEFPVGIAALVLLVAMVFSLLLLNQRLQAKEVVRG